MNKKKYYLTPKTCVNCYLNEEINEYIRYDARGDASLYSCSGYDFRRDICDHSFDDTDLGATAQGLDDLKKQVKYIQKDIRNMKKAKQRKIDE